MTVAAAAAATAMPARTEPVIDTRPRRGSETSSAPVAPVPSTMLNTPSGTMPWVSRASTTVLSGVVSLGLSTIVLPAASAGPIFQMAIMNG